MGKILQVKDLKISFRTVNGTVKAVRDISFDLERGETLAIVGESGSGKSVTSKAILGILAGNSIIESGEIIYDGKDLLRISEDDMHEIRGDKISMIFQDPLSSLDPIVKVGKQLTEAMLLKNKANRKRSRKEFNARLAILKEYLDLAMQEKGTSKEEAEKKNSENTKLFDNFNVVALKCENTYNEARTKAVECVADLDDYLFRIEKKQSVSVPEICGKIGDALKEVKDRFLTYDCDAQIAEHRAALTRFRISAAKNGVFDKVRKTSGKADGNAEVDEEFVKELKSLRELLAALDERAKPNFFTLGYYLYKNPEAVIDPSDIEKLNRETHEYTEKGFMDDFIKDVALALSYIKRTNDAHRKIVLEMLANADDVFGKEMWDKEECKRFNDGIGKEISLSINPLAVRRESVAYTFQVSLNNAITRYFAGVKKNPKEEARFARQSAKLEEKKAKGRAVDFKVKPMQLIDLAQERQNIMSGIARLKEKFQEDLALTDIDYVALANELVDDFKAKASQIANKLTKKMARERAIKLMDEVGIPESRIRYYQYPFEFSGGMRQRIVIAIALAANPDILICDEPTTALDVTIQAQILELINKLKRERNLSVIFITHDLGVVANMADKIAVMYAGKIVEYGTSEDVFYDPRHPYTWALLCSMPDLDTNEKLDAIPGTPPNMIFPPKGDAFAERNKYALKIDFEQQPPMFAVSETHKAATWLLHPDAPKVERPKAISDRIERMKKNGGEDDGKQ